MSPERKHRHHASERAVYPTEEIAQLHGGAGVHVDEIFRRRDSQGVPFRPHRIKDHVRDQREEIREKIEHVQKGATHDQRLPEGHIVAEKLERLKTIVLTSTAHSRPLATTSPPTLRALWTDISGNDMGFASDEAVAFCALLLGPSGTVDPDLARRFSKTIEAFSHSKFDHRKSSKRRPLRPDDLWDFLFQTVVLDHQPPGISRDEVPLHEESLSKIFAPYDEPTSLNYERFLQEKGPS